VVFPSEQETTGARATYALVLTTEELLSVLEEHYVRFAREMHDDEKHDPDFEGAPELRRLSEAGYPALPALHASDPGLLGCLLEKWLFMEFLGTLTPILFKDPLPTHGFNSVDEVVVGPTETRIRGRAFRYS